VWAPGDENTHAPIRQSSNLRASVRVAQPRASVERRWTGDEPGAEGRRRVIVRGPALRSFIRNLASTSYGGHRVRDRVPRACARAEWFGGSDQSRYAWQSPLSQADPGCPETPDAWPTVRGRQQKFLCKILGTPDIAARSASAGMRLGDSISSQTASIATSVSGASPLPIHTSLIQPEQVRRLGLSRREIRRPPCPQPSTSGSEGSRPHLRNLVPLQPGQCFL